MQFRLLARLNPLTYRRSYLLALGTALLLTACNRGPSFSGPSALSVRPAGVLSPQQPSSDIMITNPTRSPVSWGLNLEPDANNVQGDWFSISTSQGTLGGGASTTLNLTLKENLPAGLYLTTVTVNYGKSKEHFLIAGQVPGGPAGTATLEGKVTTQNALIAVPGAPAPLPELQATSPSERYVPKQILVKYKTEESQLNTQQTLSAQQITRSSLLQDFSTYQLSVLEARVPGESDLLATTQDVETVAELLSHDPRVEYATANYYLEALELPNDPQVQEQFALAMAGLPAAWQIETGVSNPVTVAVLDTGFDLNHEDLAGRFLPGYDFCGLPQSEETNGGCNLDNDPGFGNDNNGHGTHVVGILAAIGNNGRGVAGTAYGSSIKVLPVKIFNDFGVNATIDTFSKGIRWAVGLEVTDAPKNRNPARIINLSLGGKFFESDGTTVNQGAVKFMQDAVNAATHEGALLIAATGNENQPFVLSPAAADHVLGVGSVDTDLRRSSFSNYSEQKLFGPGTVDLMAPGNDILSTLPNNGYGTLQGTSMSTPLVSGIAALLLSREPQLSPTELEQRLLSGAYFDPAMNQTEFGRGILRADLAFGLPGPGSKVTIAVGGTNTSSTLTTATLDFYGGSSPFTLPNLASGEYRAVALSNGKGGQLSSVQPFSLLEGETKTLELALSKLE
jgi:serine protease